MKNQYQTIGIYHNTDKISWNSIYIHWIDALNNMQRDPIKDISSDNSYRYFK